MCDSEHQTGHTRTASAQWSLLCCPQSSSSAFFPNENIDFKALQARICAQFVVHIH